MINFKNSSTDFAAIKDSLKSGSITIIASLLNNSTCKSLAVSGAAIIKNNLDGLPSRASKSIPSGITIAARPASLTAELLACGVAIPSPRPVEPDSSRAITAFT